MLQLRSIMLLPTERRRPMVCELIRVEHVNCPLFVLFFTRKFLRTFHPSFRSSTLPPTSLHKSTHARLRCFDFCNCRGCTHLPARIVASGGASLGNTLSRDQFLNECIHLGIVFFISSVVTSRVVREQRCVWSKRFFLCPICSNSVVVRLT